MTGKDKCKILKEIRKEIAEQNDIEWVVSECSHKGECKGTCPRCESEVRKLERELELRRRVGKAVALVGISAVCLTGLAACSNFPQNTENDLSGAVPSRHAYAETPDVKIRGHAEAHPRKRSQFMVPSALRNSSPIRRRIASASGVLSAPWVSIHRREAS